VAPVAPATPTVPPLPAASAISSTGSWLVWSLSLLSNCNTVPAGALSASPWFDAAPLTHACTAEVTSKVTNSPGALTCAVCTAAPSAGSVAKVTALSVQPPPTVCTVTAPGVSARLQ